jgi:hypothetical protein
MAEPWAASTHAAASTSQVFVVTGSSWGTGTTSLEVGPGSNNAPLVVSFQFLGPLQASRVEAALSPPGGITDVYGNQPSASIVSVQPNTAFQLTYYLNIPQSFPLGTYPISIGIKWNYTSSTAGNFEAHTVSVRILGTVQMSAAASQSSLNAGEVNNVTITLTNRGLGTASQINPGVSASVGSVLTVLPLVSSLAGGSSVAFAVRVYVPLAYAGAAVTLTLATAYIDAYGISGSASLPIGFYTVTVPEPVLSFSASGASLTPGQVNGIPVTLTNSGPGGATAVRTTVSAPSGFSILNQFPQVPSLQAGQSVNSTLRLFAPAAAAGTAATLTFTVAFTDPYGYSQSSTQTLGLYTASSVTISAAASLSVAASLNSLTAGLKSPVAFIIKNTGQQPAYSPTISLTASNPLVVSANSTITLAGFVINPGNTLLYSAEVTTGTGAIGGFYSGALTVTFADQFGDSHSQTVPVAFVVMIPVTQVSVSSVVSQIAVGKTSTVAFMISNTGTAPVYSPTFSLTVPAGLAVTSNATFSRSGLVINPGQRVKYVANVTNGPKTPEGAFISTLTVSYMDQFGNSRTSTFSVGLVNVGGIQMVLLDQRVVRNGTSVSVTGTLLNEGLANAYYTQVTASLTAGTSQLGTATQYVGEVDSNTPLPVALTLTIPATALSPNGTSLLSLSANYQNDFGQALQFKSSQRVSLLTGSASGGFPGAATTAQAGVGAGTVDFIRYVVLVGILLVAIGALVYIRRGRSKGKRTTSEKSDVY